MQRLISFLAIITVLTACQPSVEGKPATSKVTPIATVEISATSTSTVAPTQIPAIPTATRDPNIPLTTDTGFTLSGMDVTYNRYKETDESGNARYWSPEIGTWTESHMKDGPINLTNPKDSIYSSRLTINFILLYASNFKYKTNVGLMSQVDVADATVKGFEGVAPATQIIFSLFIHANGLTADNYGSAYNNFKTDANKQQYYSDVNTMIQNLNQGKLIDRNGKQVDYKINGQSVDFSKGIVEIWINPEDAQNDPDMYLSNGLYMKIISVNGQVVAIMSPKTEDAMQVSKFQKEVFTPVQIVTSLDSGSDLTHPSWFDNQFMGGLTEDGTDNGTAVKGNISFVP